MTLWNLCVGLVGAGRCRRGVSRLEASCGTQESTAEAQAGPVVQWSSSAAAGGNETQAAPSSTS